MLTSLMMFSAHLTTFNDSECCLCGRAIGVRNSNRACVWYEFDRASESCKEYRSSTDSSQCDDALLSQTCPDNGACG